MSKTITVHIEATNLGPHQKLKAALKVSSIQLGIFATNGTGKTFISRPLRLLGDPAPDAVDANRLLTIQQDNGKFSINIKDEAKDRIATVTLSRNNVPMISNVSGYLFHVFNRDYVRENLEEFKYRPNGEIKGYILGKEKIDLSKEKQILNEQQEEYKKKVISLEKAVNVAKLDLDKLGVRKNTTEYQHLTFDNLFNDGFLVEETEVFAALQHKHAILKAMPDTLADLVNLQPLAAGELVTAVDKFLKSTFTKSRLAEDFKAQVRAKQPFIEEGLKLVSEQRQNCPFCEQVLQADALALIDQYVTYMADEEAKQINEANRMIHQLREFAGVAQRAASNELILKNSFDRYKGYIPSAQGCNLAAIPDPTTLTPVIEELCRLLDEKKQNISQAIKNTLADAALKKIMVWIKAANGIIERNEAEIDYINDQKNNIQSEKLQLNKRLCRARFLQLRKAEATAIKELKQLDADINMLQQDILTKEEAEKIDRKTKVAELFTQLLNRFFSDKYTFDEKSFCLQFEKNILSDNAPDILSDGEKNIVAFCFYLAETYAVISHQSDFDRLFFVIDDPISSMDFHYVYAVAQCVRSLDKIFSLERVRYILLTHNLEFMSILIRNNIIKYKFLMTREGISDLKRELIMPYEEHLRDIYEVAIGEKEAGHTTANSVRHVLETINRFMAPDMKLQAFCESIDGFADNEFLYSLMHDGSHGDIRVQKAYTEQMILRGCNVVVNFVQSRLGGQIAQLKN